MTDINIDKNDLYTRLGSIESSLKTISSRQYIHHKKVENMTSAAHTTDTRSIVNSRLHGLNMAWLTAITVKFFGLP